MHAAACKITRAPAVAASGRTDADAGPIHTGIYGLCPGRTPGNPRDYFTGSSTQRCNSSQVATRAIAAGARALPSVRPGEKRRRLLDPCGHMWTVSAPE